MDAESVSSSRPITPHAIIAIVTLIAAIALLLIAFYKPFPSITVINAASVPVANVELQVLSSETMWRTHDLGTLEVGEARDVTVRSDEVRVQSLAFDIEGRRVEHDSALVPLRPGEAWRFTIEPNGEVIAGYAY